MKNDIITRLALGQNISEELLMNELEDICNIECNRCNAKCPVYKLNGNLVPMNEETNICKCIQSGPKMLEFMRSFIPQVGDIGYFYDNDARPYAIYSKMLDINKTIGTYKAGNGVWYKHFSKEKPKFINILNIS